MKVKFLPQDIVVDIKPGKSVMETAKENKLSISSSCNGMATCAECRVHIVEGEAHVLPPSAKEVELIGGGHFIDNRRLSCQLFCFGDVTVDLSGQVEKEKQGGTMKKQFLKQLNKSGDETSSVGGILVEQDQDMKKIEVSEDDKNLESTDFEPHDFYKKDSRQKTSKQRTSKQTNNRRSNSSRRNNNKWPNNPTQQASSDSEQDKPASKKRKKTRRRNWQKKKSFSNKS